MLPLAPHPPDPARFAPYGRLFALTAAAGGRAINAGTSRRQDLAAGLDLAHGSGPALAVFHAQAQAGAGPWQVLERHVLGSQTFVPLADVPWIVLVAQGDAAPDLATLAAFRLDGRWGVTLAPGTWHHPLITLQAAPFLVLERAAAGDDCTVVHLSAPVLLAV